MSASAESKLADHLASLKSERERWSLAVLKGAGMNRTLQQMLRNTDSQLVLRSLARDAGMASFLCHDADIALLFCGSREENWPHVQAMVRELLPHFQPEHIDFTSLFTFFTLKHDFSAAQEWVAAKLRQQLEAEKSAPKTAAPQERPWDALQFDKALRARAKRAAKLVQVAEDNQAYRQLARGVLRQGYDVVVAENGFEALELYNECAPDLLFLDIMMPYLDGVSVLERLMKADAQANIVMFSTQSSEEMLNKAMTMGAKGFVTKPFTAQAVLDYARRTLSA